MRLGRHIGPPIWLRWAKIGTILVAGALVVRYMRTLWGFIKNSMVFPSSFMACVVDSFPPRCRGGGYCSSAPQFNGQFILNVGGYIGLLLNGVVV